MAEAAQYIFTLKELTELMIKHQNIHEGLWALQIRFGISAANLSLGGTEHRPTALVPIMEVGIHKETDASPMTVDAAEVNPAPQTSGTKKASTKKTK